MGGALIRSDSFFAPLVNPQLKRLEKGMKVRFLRSGRQAYTNVAAGQFDFVEGETMELPEVDALVMKKAGSAEILHDEPEPEKADPSVEAPELEGEKAETKSDATGDSTTNSDAKPWD